jgi:hypothetical protein
MPMFWDALGPRLGRDSELTKRTHRMHPDVQTMTAQARIEQWLRDAAEARLAAQARAGRRHARRHPGSREVTR